MPLTTCGKKLNNPFVCNLSLGHYPPPLLPPYFPVLACSSAEARAEDRQPAVQTQESRDLRRGSAAFTFTFSNYFRLKRIKDHVAIGGACDMRKHESSIKPDVSTNSQNGRGIERSFAAVNSSRFQGSCPGCVLLNTTGGGQGQFCQSAMQSLCMWFIQNGKTRHRSGFVDLFFKNFFDRRLWQ